MLHLSKALQNNLSLDSIFIDSGTNLEQLKDALTTTNIYSFAVGTSNLNGLQVLPTLLKLNVMIPENIETYVEALLPVIRNNKNLRFFWLPQPSS